MAGTCRKRRESVGFLAQDIVKWVLNNGLPKHGQEAHYWCIAAQALGKPDGATGLSNVWLHNRMGVKDLLLEAMEAALFPDHEPEVHAAGNVSQLTSMGTPFPKGGWRVRISRGTQTDRARTCHKVTQTRYVPSTESLTGGVDNSLTQSLTDPISDTQSSGQCEGSAPEHSDEVTVVLDEEECMEHYDDNDDIETYSDSNVIFVNAETGSVIEEYSLCQYQQPSVLPNSFVSSQSGHNQFDPVYSSHQQDMAWRAAEGRTVVTSYNEQGDFSLTHHDYSGAITEFTLTGSEVTNLQQRHLPRVSVGRGSSPLRKVSSSPGRSTRRSAQKRKRSTKILTEEERVMRAAKSKAWREKQKSENPDFKKLEALRVKKWKILHRRLRKSSSAQNNDTVHKTNKRESKTTYRKRTTKTLNEAQKAVRAARTKAWRERQKKENPDFKRKEAERVREAKKRRKSSQKMQPDSQIPQENSGVDLHDDSQIPQENSRVGVQPDSQISQEAAGVDLQDDELVAAAEGCSSPGGS